MLHPVDDHKSNSNMLVNNTTQLNIFISVYLLVFEWIQKTPFSFLLFEINVIVK
jgi:hypothetical protein